MTLPSVLLLSSLAQQDNSIELQYADSPAHGRETWTLAPQFVSGGAAIVVRRVQ